MFSGLTNQVSSWMTKKTDEDVRPEEPTVGEESPVIVNNETQPETELKKESSTGGSRLIGSVKSQMSSVSSWLTRKEEPQSPPAPTPEPEAPTEPGAKEKEDDDSSATGGADSEAGGSEGSGTPIDDQSGQNFGADDDLKVYLSERERGLEQLIRSIDARLRHRIAVNEEQAVARDRLVRQRVSELERRLGEQDKVKLRHLKPSSTIRPATTKALAGAKSLGSLLYSAVNKAGKTVSEASAKIKKTVEENSLLGEFSKEQEAFIKEKAEKNGGAPVPPWVGCPNQEALREECLALSTDRRNFVRAPPEGVEFSFDMEREFSICQAILQEDPNLEKMRFELVPKIINEESFWRNYLYRVALICQAAEVSNMAESTAAGGVAAETTAGVESDAGFVSEEFPASSEDIREVQEGMKKLGINTDQESQEWEKELEAELQDYEMIGDKSIGNADLVDSDIDDLK